MSTVCISNVMKSNAAPNMQLTLYCQTSHTNDLSQVNTPFYTAITIQRLADSNFDSRLLELTEAEVTYVKNIKNTDKLLKRR